MPVDVAWQGDSSKSGQAAGRQGKPGPSQSLSITLQSSRGPRDETRGPHARRRKKINKNLDTRAILALWGANVRQVFPGPAILLPTMRCKEALLHINEASQNLLPTVITSQLDTKPLSDTTGWLKIMM